MFSDLYTHVACKDTPHTHTYTHSNKKLENINKNEVLGLGQKKSTMSCPVLLGPGGHKETATVLPLATWPGPGEINPWALLCDECEHGEDMGERGRMVYVLGREVGLKR